MIAWCLIRISIGSGERPPHWAVLVLVILAGTFISGTSYSYLYSFYRVNTVLTIACLLRPPPLLASPGWGWQLC
jgi:hypothetical protein